MQNSKVKTWKNSEILWLQTNKNNSLNLISFKKYFLLLTNVKMFWFWKKINKGFHSLCSTMNRIKILKQCQCCHFAGEFRMNLEQWHHSHHRYYHETRVAKRWSKKASFPLKIKQSNCSPLKDKNVKCRVGVFIKKRQFCFCVLLSPPLRLILKVSELASQATQSSFELQTTEPFYLLPPHRNLLF